MHQEHGTSESGKTSTHLGWRVHQLDQCVFLLYDGSELIGTIGVYVDDFIIAGKVKDTRWQKAKGNLVSLYSRGKWESKSFTLCGARYHQKSDYSIRPDQQDFTRKLHQADFKLPRSLHEMNGKTKLDAAGLKTLMGNQRIVAVAGVKHES